MGTSRNKSKRLLGNRNKQAVQVLNKIDLDYFGLGETEIPGNPVGMSEDPNNHLSANFGTKREPRRGGCYKGDGSSYVDVGYKTEFEVQNFRLEFYLKFDVNSTVRSDFMVINGCHYPNGTGLFLRDEYGATTDKVLLVFPNINGHVQHIIVGFVKTLNKYYHFDIVLFNNNLKVYIDGILKLESSQTISFNRIEPYSTTRFLASEYQGNVHNIAKSLEIFGIKYSELTSDGKFVRVLGKWNCSENSGDICYDSSGNNHHGTIVNAVTATPEENPNSIHQYQDVYSFENEEGFNISNQSLIPKKIQSNLDVLNNPLQYQGKVPGLVKFVNSPCFAYNGYGYVDCGIDSPELINSNISYTFGCKVIVDDYSLNSNNTTGIFGCLKTSGFDRWGITEVNGYLHIVNFDSDTIPTGYLLPKNTPIDISVKYLIQTSELTVSVKIDSGVSVVYQATQSAILHSVSTINLLVGIYDINNSGTLFNGKIWDCYVKQDGDLILYYPFGEPIIDASRHIYHEVLGFKGTNNIPKHAILKQGTKSNQGKQNITHYLQRGFNKFEDESVINYQSTLPVKNALIPISLNSTLDHNVNNNINNHVDVNGIPIKYKQDGKSFLDSDAQLRPYNYPALRNADTDNIWDRDVAFGRFKTQNPIQRKEYFGKGSWDAENFNDAEDDIVSISGITNITTYLNNLTPVQDIRERKIRNIFITGESRWLLKDGYWDNTGIWENTAFFIIK